MSILKNLVSLMSLPTEGAGADSCKLQKSFPRGKSEVSRGTTFQGSLGLAESHYCSLSSPFSPTYLCSRPMLKERIIRNLVFQIFNGFYL